MSRTLEQAIEHAEDIAISAIGSECREEHKQLAGWLRELQERRKAPEIVRCGECKYFEDADFGGYCNNEKTYAIKTDSEFGCILGERRTDE